jgi:hypothetical protein
MFGLIYIHKPITADVLREQRNQPSFAEMEQAI